MDFAVIGIGRFGSAVVRTLFEMGHHVLAMDKHEDALRRVADVSTHAVQIDSTDSEALRAVLAKVGADAVVYPERDSAIRLARTLGSRHVVDLLELSPGFMVEEVSISPKVQGRSLADLDLRTRTGVNVLLIKRDSQILVTPPAETQLQQGDVLVVVGDKAQLARLESVL